MSRILRRTPLRLGRGFATASKIQGSPLESGTFIDYEGVSQQIRRVRRRHGKPLTLSEKILYGHLEDPDDQELKRGASQLRLRPKRVALHDANAQMALLQYMTTGIPRVRVPTSVHTDHLITARDGAAQDMERAIAVNKEVYDFLQTACAKYGIAFWRPGAGILHQVIFEQYAYPGGLMIGSDSHTPNAAGLGMLGIGVGGMEAVDVMAGLAYEVKHPNIIGVNLTGQLGPWSTTKDIILKVASILTVRGGTGSIIEYMGPGAEQLSATGMGTIGNMGAEVGATCSIFPYNRGMADYLDLTGRSTIAQAAQGYKHDLKADEGAEYDRMIDINLSELEPHINGPFTPDLSWSISNMPQAIEGKEWPTKISAALIGSCTNSSYEDLSRAASIAEQATKAGLKLQTELLIGPGSEEIRATVGRDGILSELEDAGGLVLANACGACVGQWERPTIEKGTKNTIISSFNRNFVGRQDGNPATHSFVASPELVTAMAFSGDLHFNPLKDSIKLADGSDFRFSPPRGSALPDKGYERTLEFYEAPPVDASDVTLAVDPSSSRIQLITPFEEWSGEDHQDLKMLIKVRGKCTTDHISAAGPWYKYRGHLQNISQNLLIGAINDENGKANQIRNSDTGEFGTVPSVAEYYRDNGKKWAIVAGDNYGEGSSREAAALSPRYMGCFSVIARSMARIHETNLKKQGLLPLFFKDPADYDSIKPGAGLRLSNLLALSPGSPVYLAYTNPGQEAMQAELFHTLTERQIGWFRAGSALNTLRPRS
ncbi:aconitate hydratase, mitochondrial [Kwoniella dejecticola CBS 10117]|uniref:Aconitate hydratase, mitochondrial n=1 Tax=Kwoniella dejecticola CBS 10117 TaxID=1296121 RepID=A0A1A6A006_9TREE|nr:aconitate hydratase, mitochondrial [Kwoniella dejecticola CBS 10117]OBR83391.1 aconitate hydratase, mitochondrial [Kwoniella dejecticola CBS 10117]